MIGTNVLVLFKRNFNGGLQQQFVVKYKGARDQNWTYAGIINDSLQETFSYRLPFLEEDREYCVLLYSINAIGRSNTTEVCSIKIHEAGK